MKDSSRPERNHHPTCESGDWRMKQRLREKRRGQRTCCLPSPGFSTSRFSWIPHQNPQGKVIFLLFVFFSGHTMRRLESSSPIRDPTLTP